MEALENNPVIWNALFESAWLDTKPDMRLWLQNYAKSRYGKQNEHAEEAWEILHQKVYSATGRHDATANIMCARPTQNIDKSWHHGNKTTPYFTNKDIFPAWDKMLLAAEELGNSDGYQLDVVELTREIISYRAWEMYPKVIAAHQQGNQILFDTLAEQFLELFDDMELVLSTRKEFLTGTWVEMHRNWGETEKEKNYMEKFAKAIITVYGERTLSEGNRLWDYACREWSGIMTDLYKARFEKYFSELQMLTDKNAEPQIDWYDFDYAWTITLHDYPTIPLSCPVAACKTIYEKYRNQL